MPVTQPANAGQHPRTAHGCRADNGRCFSSLNYDAPTRTLYLTFRDGHQIKMEGMSPEVAAVWLAAEDPGCLYNGAGQLAKRRKTSTTRRRESSPGEE